MNVSVLVGSAVRRVRCGLLLRRSVVCLCLLVTSVSWAKMAEPIEMPVFNQLTSDFNLLQFQCQLPFAAILWVKLW